MSTDALGPFSIIWVNKGNCLQLRSPSCIKEARQIVGALNLGPSMLFQYRRSNDSCGCVNIYNSYDLHFYIM